MVWEELSLGRALMAAWRVVKLESWGWVLETMRVPGGHWRVVWHFSRAAVERWFEDGEVMAAEEARMAWRASRRPWRSIVWDGGGIGWLVVDPVHFCGHFI